MEATRSPAIRRLTLLETAYRPRGLVWPVNFLVGGLAQAMDSVADMLEYEANDG
jgi:hypothetical protein